jgi:hypothetical protein
LVHFLSVELNESQQVMSLITERGRAMQKVLLAVLAVVIVIGGMMTLTSCQRAKAAGKLQIMYSGNIRGNVSPCG